MRPLQTTPYMLHDEEGQRLESLGALVLLKATSEQTGGAFNLFEVSCPPAYATPLPIHYAEDVAVYVLEGALTFFWGSEQMAAVPGSYFYQPRGIPHGFRVAGRTPARMLYLTFPAGLDRFVVAQEQLAPNAEPWSRWICPNLTG
jgi:quercetin dioxygenase-like cupin family protein